MEKVEWHSSLNPIYFSNKKTETFFKLPRIHTIYKCLILIDAGEFVLGAYGKRVEVKTIFFDEMIYQSKFLQRKKYFFLV